MSTALQMWENGESVEALMLVARALPKRYVVAWACECFKSVLANSSRTADVDRGGLALVQQWLVDPTEDNRRAALEFAEAGGFRSPGAWIAASAGWTGGSLAPRGYDPIPPPDHLPAEAAVAALRLAASQSENYDVVMGAFITRAQKLFGASLQEARA